jgi:hypothetical protein
VYSVEYSLCLATYLDRLFWHLQLKLIVWERKKHYEESRRGISYKQCNFPQLQTNINKFYSVQFTLSPYFLFGICQDFQKQNNSVTNKLWETPNDKTGSSDNSVGMITKLQDSNPPLCSKSFYCSTKGPNRLWGPSNLVFSEYKGFFNEGKAGRGYEWVDLYFHSPNMCYWLGQVQILQFPFTSFINHPSIWCYIILSR